MRQTEIFVILGHWKIKILKLKKTPCDIIILHICTINDNHMMYGSWDIVRDGQNFLKFWTTFRPFSPLTNWKIKILKKWKKCLEILPSYIGVPVYHKLQSYDAWFLRYRATDRILSFWTIFCLFTTLKTQKIKILKNWKKRLDIL